MAAVVGVTMPRFCLYGHTVHIASKMENTSLRKYYPGKSNICAINNEKNRRCCGLTYPVFRIKRRFNYKYGMIFFIILLWRFVILFSKSHDISCRVLISTFRGASWNKTVT